MKCSYCGRDIQETDRYWSYCGGNNDNYKENRYTNNDERYSNVNNNSNSNSNYSYSSNNNNYSNTYSSNYSTNNNNTNNNIII